MFVRRILNDHTSDMGRGCSRTRRRSGMGHRRNSRGTRPQSPQSLHTFPHRHRRASSISLVDFDSGWVIGKHRGRLGVVKRVASRAPVCHRCGWLYRMLSGLTSTRITCHDCHLRPRTCSVTRHAGLGRSCRTRHHACYCGS